MHVYVERIHDSVCLSLYLFSPPNLYSSVYAWPSCMCTFEYPFIYSNPTNFVEKGERISVV